jgi:PAS domain S-box-containing protein
MRTQIAIGLLIAQGVIVTALLVWNRRGIQTIATILNARHHLERAISDFSARLISSSLEDIDQTIQAGLAGVLRATGAARVCWYVLREGSSTLEKRHSVSRPGTESSPEIISSKDIPFTFEKLMNGEAVILHGLHDLPESAHVDRKFMEGVAVEGLILIASTCGTDWRGILVIVAMPSDVDHASESIGQLSLLNNLIVTTMERNVTHTMLQKSEQRFRCLFKEAPIGIALEDSSGKLLFVNPALCSMLGYPEEELRGKTCEEISAPDMSDNDDDLFHQLLNGSIRHYRIERKFVRKDGSCIWGRVEVSLLRNQEHGIPLVIGMMEDITLQKTSKRELEKTRCELQELAGHLIQAHEEERHRISRELHDDIGQRLALLAMDLDLLSCKLEEMGRNQQSEQLCALKSQVDDLTSDIHQMSHQLHSAKLQSLGLPGALEELCKQVARQHQIHVDFSMPSPAASLSPDLSLCIFRVTQEALSNAVKHSRSERISVHVSSSDQFLRLNVQDYGVGFDPRSSAGGIGLISMRERLRLVGGRLSVKSLPGNGTTVSALVNLPRQSSAA